MKKVIKYTVRDKNRLMLDKQTDRQLSIQARRVIRDNIFNNITPVILVDNIIFWDLLEDMRPRSINEN